MDDIKTQAIIDEYHGMLANRVYPCVGAKAALAKEQIHCFVADNISLPTDDKRIIEFLYDFVAVYRKANSMYHSASVIFRNPQGMTEDLFDKYLWERLQALHELDAVNYNYDKRVKADPASPEFSFSIKEEAFFIIGMNSNSSRLSRRFRYPALVFNPHHQFQQLRAMDKYNSLKEVVRKRETLYSGSINPVLDDYGNSSEVYQYSGKQYDDTWTCPLVTKEISNNKPSQLTWKI